MTKAFSFRQSFLGFYSGRAKDIDNDNNIGSTNEIPGRKSYFIKSKSIITSRC